MRKMKISKLYKYKIEISIKYSVLSKKINLIIKAHIKIF